MPTRQVALITGSGRRRIGNVVARALAQVDYAIGLHYNSSDAAAAQTLQEIRGLGVPCELFQADVADETQVAQMFDAARDRFGRLDVLVTTASIWESAPLEQVTATDVMRNFEVNTLGTFLCAQRAGLQMVSQAEGGIIITMGDWAIERPYLDHTPYFIAKGAIPTLTRSLAVELAHRNPRVRVNCIHPGPVMFPPDCSENEQAEMVESTLVKRANNPEVISDAVKFLIANEFVTGICLPVDGGRTIFANETTRKRPI